MIASSTHDDGTMRDAFLGAPARSDREALTLSHPPIPLRFPNMRSRMMGGNWRIRARARRVMAVQVTGRSKPEVGAGEELET